MSITIRTRRGVTERAVADVLTEYLGAEFDFSVRAQLIDVNFRYVKILGTQANEIDIVGTFKSATPKLVLKTATSIFVPYDAVALIVEVKTVMDKGKLREDLEKLARWLD